MEKDFLKKIGYAGLTSRIKRINDSLLYSTREFYKTQNLDIEPNWHMVILLLKEKGQLSNSQISCELQLSHPAVVRMINQMKAKDYIVAKEDISDNRRTLLELSEKAYKELPKLEQCWNACVETMKEITKNKKLIFEALEDIEKQLEEADYRTRTENNLKK